MKPLCFVLMPFGKKRDPGGGAEIDFDAIFERAIAPAIDDAGLEPIRADHEVTGGIIHKAMFERLLLCDFAVADLTTANANVFYELGVRHAVRRSTTLTVFAVGQPVPFDVNLLRGLPYKLGPNNSFGDEEAKALRSALAARLEEVRDLAVQQSAPDSPLVQLLQGYSTPDLAHLRTDVFRERVEYSAALSQKLRAARATRPTTLAATQLQEIERSLGELDGVENGVLIDLYLSYRAVGAFDAMIALQEQLPEVLRHTMLVREQLAFALNRKAGLEKGADRDGLRDRAIQLLKELIDERGANAESWALMGRIYKDRWDDARASDPRVARGHLRQAIAAYLCGFEADSRDAFPGVNALTVLDLEGSPESLAKRDQLLPVVRFAIDQRVRAGQPDYWDHATLLELALLANEGQPEVDRHLEDALARVREYWEPETTARNLKLLAELRRARGADVTVLESAIVELEREAQRRRGG